MICEHILTTIDYVRIPEEWSLMKTMQKVR